MTFSPELDPSRARESAPHRTDKDDPERRSHPIPTEEYASRCHLKNKTTKKTLTLCVCVPKKNLTDWFIFDGWFRFNLLIRRRESAHPHPWSDKMKRIFMHETLQLT